MQDLQDNMERADRPATVHWTSSSFAMPAAFRQERAGVVARTARSARNAEDVLGALLVGSCPPLAIDGWTRRPLWNDEATHRAYRLLQLLLRLRARQGDARDWRVEYGLAAQLAADFRSLSEVAENQCVACSGLLLSIIHTLNALFGPAVGDIELETHVEPMSLLGYRRRALVLAASELVINALSHAFAGRARGRIGLSLKRTDGGRARLNVANDGEGSFEGNIDASASLAGRLGRLLEGRLAYRRYRAGVAAEITFARVDSGSSRGA
jgi:two-component sensor histidine kinase